MWILSAVLGMSLTAKTRQRLDEIGNRIDLLRLPADERDWVTKRFKPGDRKDPYTVRPGAMIELVRAQSAPYASFTDVLGQGSGMFNGESAERTARLRDLHEIVGWLATEMPPLTDR